MPMVNVTSMSTKMSKQNENATVKTKSLGNYQQSLKGRTPDIKQKSVTMNPSKEILLGQDHVIEVTVKKIKGQKRTSPTVSFSPGQKAFSPEKKRSTTNDRDPPHWGNVFRRQNLLLMTKEQASKRSEDREAKKNINVKKQQKSTKSEEKHLKTPCCSSPSILVRDCAAQCPEICNSNKLAEFNSAHVMSDKLHMLSLIKQLQDLVNKKDKRTCEIFTEMEHIMQRIPDLEFKVESKAVPLKDKNEFMLEREKLQSEILKRDEQLKEVNQKYSKLAFDAEKLTQQLAEATREKNNVISVVADLRQQIEDKEKIITGLETGLKTDLNKQTELAHKYFIDNEYLTMEIDKLSTLSSYKDKQIIDYRDTVRELQSQIAKQLKTVNEICMKEGSKSSQISLIHTGHACSSPTSSFSNDSDKSWHDLSDISTVDSVLEERVLKKNTPVKDFELVSLLDEESSHSIMPDQNKITNDKRSAMQNNENNTFSYQNVDTNDVNAKKSLRHFSKKGHNKESDIYKMSITAYKSIVSDIRKQGDMQNRKPVNVPSPLRDCPHPDWSDGSSLPSTVSYLDMVPSNDV